VNSMGKVPKDIDTYYFVVENNDRLGVVTNHANKYSKGEII